MRRTNGIFALDVSGVRRALFIIRKSPDCKANLSDCRLADVPAGVVGLFADVQQTFAHSGVCRVFYWAEDVIDTK